MPNLLTKTGVVANDVDDALWCYARLDDPNVCREHAPSAGAWNMLRWARNARDRFYLSLLPRALDRREAAQWEAAARAADDDRPLHCLEPDEIASSVGMERELLRLEGASEQLFADAEALVHQWDRQVGASLPAHYAVSSASAVALCVHDAATVARHNARPDAEGIARWR